MYEDVRNIDLNFNTNWLSINLFIKSVCKTCGGGDFAIGECWLISASYHIEGLPRRKLLWGKSCYTTPAVDLRKKPIICNTCIKCDVTKTTSVKNCICTMIGLFSLVYKLYFWLRNVLFCIVNHLIKKL